EFYALTSKLDDFKIHFRTEGPNGIGRLKAFEVISDSALSVASTYRIRLWITDFEGNVQKTLKTDRAERKGKPFVQIYYTNQPLVFDRKKNDLYVFTRADTDYSSPGIWSGTMFLKMPSSDEPPKHVFELPSHFHDYV